MWYYILLGIWVIPAFLLTLGCFESNRNHPPKTPNEKADFIFDLGMYAVWPLSMVIGILGNLYVLLKRKK